MHVHHTAGCAQREDGVTCCNIACIRHQASRRNLSFVRCNLCQPQSLLHCNLFTVAQTSKYSQFYSITLWLVLDTWDVWTRWYLTEPVLQRLYRTDGRDSVSQSATAIGCYSRQSVRHGGRQAGGKKERIQLHVLARLSLSAGMACSEHRWKRDLGFCSSVPSTQCLSDSVASLRYHSFACGRVLYVSTGRSVCHGTTRTDTTTRKTTYFRFPIPNVQIGNR